MGGYIVIWGNGDERTLHAFDGAVWWPAMMVVWGKRDDKRLPDVLRFDITYIKHMEGPRPPHGTAHDLMPQLSHQPGSDLPIRIRYILCCVVKAEG